VDPWPPLNLIRWIWIGLGILWLAGALMTKRAARTQPIGARLIHTAMMLVAFLLLVQIRAGFLGWRFVPASPASEYAGLAMVIAGAAFAAWARLSLGSNWSGLVMVKQHHELIQSGPYGIVRHPIYSGLMLAALGTAVAIGQLGCLLGFAVAAVAWWMKWRVEERFMTERFGSRYEEYKRRVNAVIPFVF